MAQIRAAQSGEPPKIDLAKKPKKKKIDSDASKEQVSPAPKAKKKSTKNRVAAATVLTAAAVNLIGCQLFTLSRIGGIVETLGIQPLVEAQARNRVRAVVSIPGDLFTTGSMESSSSGMPNSVWRREAHMAQERLNQRPAVEGRETQQQNTVAAAGGDVPDVGGTPVPAAPPKAPATSLTRQYLGLPRIGGTTQDHH